MKAHLIALSSAAVLTVYAAGYAKTRSAADQLAAQSAERRPPPVAPRDMDGVVTAGRGQPPARPVNVEGRGQLPASDSATRAAAEPASRIDSSRGAAAAPLVAQRADAPSAQRPVETLAAATPAPTAASAVQVESGSFAAPAAVPSIAAPTERPPVETPAVAPKPEKPEGPHYKDGHYYGMGYSRHGDIEASIWIEAGKISTASISKCLTRYPCDWIAKLPGQVVFRQSADVDFVSGATESVSAFYYAVLEALGKAQQ